MGFTAAGVAVPGNGTANDNAFFLTLFNDMFTRFNADDDILTAATNAATPSTLLKRDGSGGAAFAGTLAAAIIAASGNVSIQGTLLGVAAATLQSTLLVQGAVTLQSTLNVTGAITATGGVVGNASTASALLAPVGFNALSSEYRPTTNGSAGFITLGAGPFYPDSSGNIVAGATAQNVALSNAVSAAQPTGTNSQYVLITFAPGSTTPTVTGGTVSAGTPTPPASPAAANWPIALVLWRGATTNPSNIIAAADIFDLRGKGWGGGGTGGGTTDTTVRAAALLTKGANATFSNDQDVTNAAGGIGIHPGNISTATTLDGTLLGLTGDFVPVEAATRIYRSSATTLTLPAGPTVGAGASSPFGFAIAQRYALLTADLTSVAAAGTAGPRYITLDITTSGSPVMRMKAIATFTTYQRWIGTVEWDGSTLVDGSYNWSPLLNTDSRGLSLYQVRADAASSSGTVNGQTSAVLLANSITTGAPLLSNVYLPVGGRVNLRNLCTWQIVTLTAPGEYFYGGVRYRTSAFGGAGAGSWQDPPINATDAHVYMENSRVAWGKNTEEIDIILGSGVYDFTQVLSFSGGTASTAQINMGTVRSLIATIFAG